MMNDRWQPSLYETSSIKRRRRTKTDIKRLRNMIYEVLLDDHPMTVRGVFYQLVVRGAIDKTENQYKTVSRLLTKMRREQEIPFSWIVDGTRLMRKPRSHTSLEAALQFTAETYRRALWNEQPVYVEVWCESDAISGVLYQETEVWDIPLMVSRGFSSVTFLHNSASYIMGVEKPAYVYYFGDFDPSGMDITRQIEEGIREFALDADVHFERVAVTPEQILNWSLPGRPPKPSDSRIKRFAGQAVELDAVPAAILRQLVRQCVSRHIDQEIVDAWETTERLERDTLRYIAESWQSDDD